jgi:tetratricopeptide (TPR) repeat protein
VGVGYCSYYLAFFALSYLLRYPWLLFGVLAVAVLQRWLPDPWVWMRTASRMRSLRAQVDLNAANVTARRDLARLYLERGRPARAIALLDQARERTPDQPELLLLTGMAKLRAGEPDAALAPLVAAVERDPRVGFGEPYRLAGDALFQLGRWDEAEDAYLHFAERNSSSVEVWFKIFRVRARAGRRDDARAALDQLFSTWRSLPGFHRRKQWSWWLRACSARVLG